MPEIIVEAKDESDEEKNDNPYLNYVQQRSQSVANLGSGIKTQEKLEYVDAIRLKDR